MPPPFRRARVLNAIGQPCGDPEPLLNRRQQQYPGIRGHLPAVESDMHLLALHRWQARQNPRTFVHGWRELRCFRLIWLRQPNHTRNQLFMSLPPPSSQKPGELLRLKIVLSRSSSVHITAIVCKPASIQSPGRTIRDRSLCDKSPALIGPRKSISPDLAIRDEFTLENLIHRRGKGSRPSTA